jgi:hypothetical protein
MDQKITFVAELYDVREVSLHGVADSGFWTDQLAREELVPAELDGRAQLLISSAQATYLGLRFQELTISVFCRSKRSNGQDGAFFIQGFNSIGWFAWVERNLFSSPYVRGSIDVKLPPACSMQLEVGNVQILRAAMSADSAARRAPDRCDREEWSGRVFLPTQTPSRRAVRKWFYAKISGQTETYDFKADDILTLRPVSQLPAIQWLVDSQLEGRAWAIRPVANHAKSKTYRRG